MKKLLLTSTGLTSPKIAQRFVELLDKKPAETRVLFVPTAARTENEMKYVRKSAAELAALNIGEKNIIWFDANKPLSAVAPFEQYDVIYVCGGSTFYLMQKLAETSLDKEIKNLFEKGGFYVGVSAGSVSAGPFVKAAEAAGDKNDIGLKSIEGMHLTDKVIFPHYKPEKKIAVEELQLKISFKVIPLTDSQAYEEIGTKSKIFE